MKTLAKNGFSPLALEDFLLFLFGIFLVCFSKDIYLSQMSSVGQVIVLIIYLGLLVGIAPLPMPVFRSTFWQTIFAGLISGFLDSYIVLAQCKRLRTVESGQTEEAVMKQTENQSTEGVRAVLMALFMMAALIGGLIIWFGEVYAAGLYNNDGRTGPLSALFIVPPALLFLAILGFHASRLPIKVVPNRSEKFRWRDLIEFSAGVVLLLYCHNPLWCLGWLLIYTVFTSQNDQLLRVLRHEIEVSVILVLMIALIAGPWLVTKVIGPAGLDHGKFWPIVPAAIQAVLWGPLYHDPIANIWIRITTLSTGALLLPVSSLVGVMLFKTTRQWLLYMRYSFFYALVWYSIMRSYIYLTEGTAFWQTMEYLSRIGSVHH